MDTITIKIGEKMNILRDIRASTETLILFELIRDPKSNMKKLSVCLDMTVQGVSEYLKRMQDEGLLVKISGEYKLTRKGVQFLHDNITALRDFIIDALKAVEIIHSCDAVSGAKIRKGEKIGLFMEGGVLMAYTHKQSTSTGKARNNADPGDIVVVDELEGIVELSQGRLVLTELDIPEQGCNADILQKTETVIKDIKYDKLGALDTRATVVLKRLGLKCDFVHAPAAATVDAVQKGLDVVLLGSPEEIRKMISMITEANTKTANKTGYVLIHIPM